MSTVIQISARLTYHYVDGWADELDEWSHVGTMSVLGFGPRVLLDKYGESWNRWVRVKLRSVAPGVSHDEALGAIMLHFRKACRCEHDCCGHVQTHASSIRHDKRKEYIVKLHSYINV